MVSMHAGRLYVQLYCSLLKANSRPRISRICELPSLPLEGIHLQVFILDVSASLKYDSQFHTCLVNQNIHNSELDKLVPS